MEARWNWRNRTALAQQRRCLGRSSPSRKLPVKANDMSKDRLRALLVDDEPSFRRVLRTCLATSGFTFHEVTCGEEALEILAHRSFDLVLLDLNMPGIGGMETCREIRALLPKVGIVMITVRDAESDMVKAFEYGADDYLTKPIRFREMIARLRAVWRRLHIDDGETDVLSVGGLQLDLQQRVLHRNGDYVHLTPTEF